MPQLRNYQIQGISQIRHHWNCGKRAVVLREPTGAGKTEMFSALAKDFSGRILALSHRRELVHQAANHLSNVLGETVSIFEGGHHDLSCRAVSASIQSFASLPPSSVPPGIELIVFDECFVAGTLIDNKPIEILQPGDLVTAFNEQTGKLEKQPIKRIFRHQPSQLCTVKIGTRSLVCTPNHPFFTNLGWKTASTLERGTMVLCTTQPNTVQLRRLFVEAGRGSRAAGEEINNSPLTLSSPAPPAYQDSSILDSSQTPEDPPLFWLKFKGVISHKPQTDGQFEQLCYDGFVYNLEVEQLHTYIANGVIVHNCHHAPADHWHHCLNLSPSAKALGCTATPLHPSGIPLAHLFDVMVDGPQVRSLIDSGYLCDYNLYSLPKPATITGARSATSLLKLWLKIAARLPTLIFANSIAHSIDIVNHFNAANISAGHIDAHTDHEERDRLLCSLKDGSLKVLSNYKILTEGVDIPVANVLILLRKMSLIEYLQACGRVLRIHPDKPKAQILDFANNWFRHGLPDDVRQWSLDGHNISDRRRRIQCPNCHRIRVFPPLTRGIFSCPTCRCDNLVR